MPLRKYRSVEEMPGLAPLTPLEPENLRIACELSELARRLGGWTLPPGVRRSGRSTRPPGLVAKGRTRKSVRAGVAAASGLVVASTPQPEAGAKRGHTTSPLAHAPRPSAANGAGSGRLGLETADSRSLRCCLIEL